MRCPSLMKHRYSEAGLMSFHRRSTKSYETWMERSAVASVQFSNGRERSCWTKSDAFRSMMISPKLEHLRERLRPIQAASFGALQLSFVKTDPPRFTMADDTSEERTGKVRFGRTSSSEVLESLSDQSVSLDDEILRLEMDAEEVSIPGGKKRPSSRR